MTLRTILDRILGIQPHINDTPTREALEHAERIRREREQRRQGIWENVK